ncbi:MAG: PHP domain-containing protein [Chitinophagaceae bacterium]
MDNTEIADQFTLVAKLMDIHGENSFKILSYSKAASAIDKLPFPITHATPDAIFKIPGIGESIGKNILLLIEKGSLPVLQEYLDKTPSGILEMLKIKGLGPKKISTIWKDLNIENLGELLYACNENRLLLYKGFGLKSQENIRLSIEFYLSNQEKYLFSQLEKAGLFWESELRNKWAPHQVNLTGDFRRKSIILEEISLLVGASIDWVRKNPIPDLTLISEGETMLVFKTADQIRIKIYTCPKEKYAWNLFLTTGSDGFLEKFSNFSKEIHLESADSEEQIFEWSGLPNICPSLREEILNFSDVQKHGIPDLIHTQEIRSIIHAHSNWSDGSNSVEEMALYSRENGYEYLVITDHSQSAFYANGLKPFQILDQQEEIENLNGKLFPFKIFKGIESDILNDGYLDYPDSLLATFDVVIASIHSNLKMTQEKAMSRLIKAIENPYTTILGHPTSRLLLARKGFPVDHERIIDACAQHRVVIEINAHPRRLDLDWHWIPYAIRQGVLLSINPDAHHTEGIQSIHYGILAAQKGGLTKRNNLSSFSLPEFENFIKARKEWKGI